MSEVRLVVDYSEISIGNRISLSKEDRHYLFNVLKCLPGNSIIVLDGKGRIFKGKIADYKCIEILEEHEDFANDSRNLILCQALLKGDKMDLVIQKSAEIGIRKIIPFVCERCIPKKTNKIKRWRKIVKESTEISKGAFVPEIGDLMDFEELILTTDNGIIFWESAENPLIDALLGLNFSKPVFLIVGPEGGFSKEEIEKARRRGIQIASLGKRILRAETAAIFSLSVVSFLLENYDIIKNK